jgi:hypothetical protein
VAVGIDITPHSLSLTREKDAFKTDTQYGVVGVTSRWHEPILWTNPKAIRTTSDQGYLSLSQLWQDFNEDYKQLTSIKSIVDEEAADIPTIELIIEALGANIPLHSAEFSILAIDNTISEFHQSALHRQLGNAGFGRRELLWRPIALALAHLMTPHEYKDGDSLLIVDTESYRPEITLLKLIEYKEHLVPLRAFPEQIRKPRGDKWSGYSSANALEQLAHELSDGEEALFNQLMLGPFSGEFFRYLDLGESEDIWIREGLNHSKLKLNAEMRKELEKSSIAGNGFDELHLEVEQVIDDHKPTVTLWHGLPARLNSKSLNADQLLLEAESVSSGAAEYGRRRLADEPTYRDTLPGLEILSLEKKTGSHKFFTVIPAGEVEGGQKVSIQERLTDFKLEEGTEDFTAILKNTTTETYKRLVTKLPPIDYQGENIPLIMDAETQPAQGHATITIEGVGEQLELFGPQRILELDWESGEDVKIEDIIVYKYNGPEVYPVRGRIADDPDCRKAADYFVENCAYMGSKVPFRNKEVSYARVHERWGYYDPFGRRLKDETTRAMFGAMLEEDEDIALVAKKVSDKIYATVKDNNAKFKYLNHMYRYSPEKYRDELRSIFQKEEPQVNSNTIIAVGYTFHQIADFELFVNFLLNHSHTNGYPDYPSEKHTGSYFWAFFRALCHYDDPVDLPIIKAEKVLDTVYSYTIERASSNWAARPFERNRKDVENLVKFILSAVLFSIRFRKKQPNFLGKETSLYNRMVEVVDEMTPRLDYPKTMFETRQPDKLNDFVLRFLNDTQTKQDLGVLKGLVVE